MELQILFRGSDVLAIIEEAREQNWNYEEFSSQIESYIKWNKGTSAESILRKIYAKYIFKGSEKTDEIDIFYNNIKELINNSITENEIQEVESIIASLLSEGKIDAKDYNYLLGLINEKRKEL